MKKYILFIFLIFIFSCGKDEPPKQQQQQQTQTKIECYICSGETAKRYHRNNDCRGLSNCKGTIEGKTIKEAESLGRTPCKICY